MNPVVHFEMPYEDKDRMAEFYTRVFYWKMQKLGKEMGDYVLAQTTDVDEKQMPKNPGSINGGFFKKTDDKLSHFPSVVIAVNDIREAMKKVEESGGKVLGGIKPGEPDDIQGVGLYISFADTEGNKVGMLQPYQR